MAHRWSLALALVGCVSSNGGERAPARLTNAVAAPTLSPEQARMAATIADPLGFLPADSEVVVYADFERVRDSAVFRALEPTVRETINQLQSVMPPGCAVESTALGRTVRWGMKGLGSHQLSMVMVFTSTDAPHFMKCVGGIEGATRDGDYGVVPGRTGGASAFALVDPTTIVTMTGPDAGRDRLATIVHGGAPLRHADTFAGALSMIDPQAGAWFLVDGHTSMFDGYKGLGLAFQTIVGGIHVVDGLAARLQIRVDSPANATALSSTIATQFAPARTMVEHFDVATHASDVVVDLRMTDAQVLTMLDGLGLAPPPTTP